jgi:hypothetical protein
LIDENVIWRLKMDYFLIRPIDAARGREFSWDNFVKTLIILMQGTAIQK